MKLFAAVVLILISMVCVGEAVSQDKQDKHASVDVQNKILRIQKLQASLELKYRACQTEMVTDKEGFDDSEKQKQAAVAEAFKAAKLSPQEWDLNLDTFEFTRHVPAEKQEGPAPVPAAPTPAAKP